tara:strand:- start:640 stop:756 length:117 start_codon:yes stop_codon:yes gene_type:complete
MTIKTKPQIQESLPYEKAAKEFYALKSAQIVRKKKTND